MNLQIEQSVSDWLASLEAFEGIAIHCGQSDQEIPNDEPLIMVACEDINNPAPTLVSASVRVIVSTPSVIADSFNDHRNLVASLRNALNNDIGTLPEYSSYLLIAGAAVNGWNESQSNDRWLSQVNLTLGMVEL
ncbi:MAG: hypothetical protein ACO3GE_08620 [Steroidobacteraceae bacterium]